MAIAISNTCDTGLADGTTLTALSSGAGGQEFNSTLYHGSLKASTAQTLPRTATSILVDMSGALTRGSFYESNGGLVSGSAASTADSWIRMYVYFAANPTARTYICMFCMNAGDSLSGLLAVNTNGTVSVYSGQTLGLLATTTTAIALNQWVRIEARVTQSGTVGGASVRLYNDPESSTATDSNDGALSFNTGSTAHHVQWRFGGGYLSATSSDQFYMSRLAVSDVDWIGPYEQPTPYAANMFDDGETDGTTLTTSNTSGAGRAADNITGTPTFDSTHAVSGSQSMKIDMSGGNTQQLRWTDASDQASADSYIRFFVWLDAYPDVTNKVAVIASHLNTFLCQIRIKTNGTVDMVDDASTVMGVTTTSIATGQWVRIEAKVTQSSTAGHGVLKLFNDPYSAVPDEVVVTANTFNTWTSHAGNWRFGGNVSSASAAVYWVDDIGVGDQFLDSTILTQTIDVGPAAETDAAGTFTASKSGATTAATETDTAGTFTASKSGGVDQAAETDTAGSFSGAKSGTFTGAAETDAAGTFAGAKFGTFTGAADTETAGTFTASKSGALGTAADTETAGALSGVKSGTFTGAAETDAAQSLTASKTGALGTAAETDAAGTFAGVKSGTFTGAAETDAAGSLTPSKRGAVGTAVELDTAVRFGGSLGIVVDPATETDAAGAFSGVKSGTFAGAADTETAGTFTASKSGALGTAVELDAAGALSGSSAGMFGTAVETDTAGAFTLTLTRRIAIGTATETNTARPIANTSVRVLPALTLGAPYRLMFIGAPAASWSFSNPERLLFVNRAERTLSVDQPARRWFVGATK